MQAPYYDGAPRLHVSLEVSDLQRSLDFYRRLFDTEPTKVRDGYARFEPDSPPVHLSLNLRPERTRNAAPGHGNLSHLGVQLGRPADLEALADRLRTLGVDGREERGVVCCYARSDKLWVADPDGMQWELFLTTDDTVDARREASAAPTTCCVPADDGGCC